MTEQKATADPRRKQLIRFIILFSILVIVGAVAYPYLSIAFNDTLKKFMAMTARICATLLSPFYSSLHLGDRVFTVRGFSIEIIEECTGLYEMLLLGAAILAYPATWKSKGLGILIGLPLIYLFNIIRIMFLAVVGVHFRSLFNFMHIYFWQATLVIMIATVWLLWIRLVASREKKSSSIFS
jgi:exosortase H (IPTLxxWG-CTERM-specific)